MHPVILGELAQHHVHSLIEEVDADRLAHSVVGLRPGLRQRFGLRLIAAGNRLACESLAGAPGSHS